ncbi:MULTISPECIES: YncE family protein [Streptomyces]|uniref:YncE family protein n=1 Tax=Streptomyces TaxID=1883 RepID=UPI0034318464
MNFEVVEYRRPSVRAAVATVALITAVAGQICGSSDAAAGAPSSRQAGEETSPHVRAVGKVNLNGRFPMFVIPSSDGRYLYADTFNANDDFKGEVAVIDAVTHKVVQTIPVGRYPQGMTLDRESNRLFVANSFDHTVSVIDVSGGKRRVVRTIAAGGITPVGIAVSRQGEKTNVLIANQGSQKDKVGGSVSTFSLHGDRATRASTVLRVPPMSSVSMIAAGPDGRIWAGSGNFDHHLFEIDPKTGDVVRTITAPDNFEPTQWGMAFTRGGHEAWAAGTYSIARINLDQGTFTQTKPQLDDMAMDAVITRDRKYALVSTLSHGMQIINTQDGRPNGSVDMGPGTTDLELSKDGQTLYSTRSGDDNLWISTVHDAMARRSNPVT